MSTWGLLSSGFSAKPTAQILADMQAQQLILVSPTLNLQPPDPLAIVTGIFAAAVGEVWQATAAVYSAADPDLASGDALTGDALLTGTARQPATATIIPAATINVAAGFAAAKGTMFANVPGNAAIQFTNNAAVNSPGGGNVSVDFICTTLGANQVNGSTLIGIAVPLAGWNSITNPTAGITGQEIQGDPALRAARVLQLAGAGSSSGAAIAAQILKYLQPSQSPLTVPGIATSATMNPFTLTAATLAVTVLYNDTDAVDANTLPPHSVEAIAYAPGSTTADDYALCALLLSAKAAGITTYSGGGTSLAKTVTDAQGTSEVVNATRPSTLTINIVITVKTKSLVTSAQVQAAFTNYVQGNAATGETAAWVPGKIVYFNATLAAMTDTRYGVPGVVNVTVMTLNGAGLDITPTARQVPILGTVTVTIT